MMIGRQGGIYLGGMTLGGLLEKESGSGGVFLGGKVGKWCQWDRAGSKSEGGRKKKKRERDQVSPPARGGGGGGRASPPGGAWPRGGLPEAQEC